MAEAFSEKKPEKEPEKEPEKGRTFLGLTHNPFVEPQKGFFERGGRKTHLEQLRHLSEWSRRVLLVTGAEGVGKTTLYRELAATLEPRVKAARINGSLVNTGYEVLSATAQGFGLALPMDANTQSLRMDLIVHIEEQTAGDRLCLALVDDAHLLDNKALESLITLAHESGLHLVFFGEVRMVPMIERAASAKGVGWQEIRLTGYGEADARDYLEWRFGQAKYRGRIPFTDNEVKDLVKLSEGLPGRINQMANVLLVKLETGEGTAERRGFPRVHVALLLLVVVVVGLLYLVAGDSGPAETAAMEEVVAVESTESAEPVEVTEPEASADENPMASAASEATEDAAEADEAGDLAALTEEVIAAEAASEATPESSAPPLESVAMEAAAAEPDQQPDQQPEPRSEPAAALKPAVDEQTTAPESAGSTATTARTPAELAPATAADMPQLPAVAKDSRWLLEQDPDYFTIQLVTVSAAESASAFVGRQNEPGDFTIYQLQRDGRILHVVLYGLFSSRGAAETAADNLPAEVGRVQPWIRPVAQVQAAARLSTLQ